MAGLNRRFALAAFVLPLLLVATTGMARAATLFVTSTGDSGTGTLRNQIAAASAGDTIEFNVTGTITVFLPLVVSKNLTITGPTGSPGITISGGFAVVVMAVDAGVVTLQNLTIANGINLFGGGIANFATLTINNCTFSHNVGTDGGGIDNFATLTVTNSTFSDNNGPGIMNGDTFSNATLTVTNSTFLFNGAVEGGGIDNFNGTLAVTNSTFFDNNANDFGGGIFNNSLGTMTVTNCTFSDNGIFITPPFTGGGGIFNDGGSAKLKGTILAGESTGGNCAGVSTPPVTDAGYNISDDPSCDFTEAPSGTSINNSTTLNLDPLGLQNNGGPTQTIALEPNSQALDFIPVADCTDQSSPTPLPLTTDQRGFPRPDSGNLNACDAGAFELQTGRLTVVPGSEKTQIARSTSGTSDQVNMGFTFTDNGSPILDDPPSIVGPHCDDGTDALNGIDVDLFEGTCASLAMTSGGLELALSPFVVHTVNHQSYGTLFQSPPTVPSPETVSARIVQLATPLGTCGQWTLNIEVAGLDTAAIGLGGGNPFALVVEDGDKNEGCFDVTNAIVGSQIPKPSHSVRRGVRRQTRR